MADKKSEKILIIDDNDDFCQFMKLLLETEGFMVFTANNGEDGVRIAYDYLPDCVVLDYLIPYVSGVEIAKKFKSDPVLRNIPVIFLTANDSKDAFIEGIDSGADDYVVKTNDFDIINTRIKAMLRMKKLQDTNVFYMRMLEQDILYAGKLQNAILQHGHTDIPQTRLVEVYKPYTKVSGDYYDVKRLATNESVIIMADVAGHGVAASMLTIFVKSFFDNNAVDKQGRIVTPDEFLTKLNKLFVSEGFDDSFFTSIFYALYNNETGRLLYAKAGHPAPLVYQAKTKKIIELTVKGMLIGVVDTAEYRMEEITLGQNDVVFMFTDGIFEIFGAGDEIFGEERLHRMFQKEMDDGTLLTDVPDIIMNAVRRFSRDNELKDDVTMLFLKRE
ncbi:MAG: SpoIIE family protein phosphatase [Spirochaetes bacterium]|nr:SpoIIE family protein phosphatase [Spirochaetota bacterium]